MGRRGSLIRPWRPFTAHVLDGAPTRLYLVPATAWVFSDFYAGSEREPFHAFEVDDDRPSLYTLQRAPEAPAAGVASVDPATFGALGAARLACRFAALEEHGRPGLQWTTAQGPLQSPSKRVRGIDFAAAPVAAVPWWQRIGRRWRG